MIRVRLEYPLVFRGAVYDSIGVKQLAGREFDRWAARAAADPAAVMEIFDAPPEVVRALDADDAERVNDALDKALAVPMGIGPKSRSGVPLITQAEE